MKHCIVLQKPATPDLYRRGSCQPLVQSSELVLSDKQVFAPARVLHPTRVMVYPLVLYTNTALQNMLLVVRLLLHQFLLNYSGSGGGKTNGDYDRFWDSNIHPLLFHVKLWLGQLVVWSIANTWGLTVSAYLTPLLRQ